MGYIVHQSRNFAKHQFPPRRISGHRHGWKYVRKYKLVSMSETNQSTSRRLIGPRCKF
eukprot:GSA25T00021478001.1